MSLETRGLVRPAVGVSVHWSVLPLPEVEMLSLEDLLLRQCILPYQWSALKRGRWLVPRSAHRFKQLCRPAHCWARLRGDRQDGELRHIGGLRSPNPAGVERPQSGSPPPPSKGYPAASTRARPHDEVPTCIEQRPRLAAWGGVADRSPGAEVVVAPAAS